VTRSSKDQNGLGSVRPFMRPGWTTATVSVLFTGSLALWIAIDRSAGALLLLLLYVVSAVAALCGRSAARYSVIFTALLASLVLGPRGADHASGFVVMDIAALVASGAGVVLLIWWTGTDEEDAPFQKAR
jgi:hypothetical protein